MQKGKEQQRSRKEEKKKCERGYEKIFGVGGIDLPLMEIYGQVLFEAAVEGD